MPPYQKTEHFPIYSNAYGNTGRDRRDEEYFSYRCRSINSGRDIVHRSSLERLLLHHYRQLSNVDLLYNLYMTDLAETHKKAYPSDSKRRKCLDLEKQFLTIQIKAIMKRKHCLQKKYIRFPITFGNKFRQIRNDVNNLIIDTKNK